jgi:hypothetical protein
MNQTIQQLSLSLTIGLTTIGLATIGLATIGLLAPAQANPILRAKPNTQQVPGCYIEMPNALPRDLNELCMVGKVLGPRPIDMVTDANKDGVPDELALEFDKIERIQTNMYGPGKASPEQIKTGSQQMLEAIRSMNERMPYGESTKSAMRETTQLLSQMASGAFNPVQSRRMGELGVLMRSDPMYGKIEGYYREYNQVKSKAGIRG